MNLAILLFYNDDNPWMVDRVMEVAIERRTENKSTIILRKQKVRRGSYRGEDGPTRWILGHNAKTTRW